MAKPAMLSRVLHLPVTSLGSCVLALVTVIQLFSYGLYNYPELPLSALEQQLYKEISPKLELKKGNQDCNYADILQRTDSLNVWEIEQSTAGFSAQDVMNGSYSPRSCNPQFSVAILVTYRNRQSQLDIFVQYMHNFLRKQNIHYKIFVIEQQDEKPWNKGMLYNIGAKYAMLEKFPCLILHDVDLLPLDSANLYTCLYQPRHMSASIDKFRYVLPYSWLVGGVLAIRTDQYTAVNGFSNRFQGWGGEDDDFYERMTVADLKVLRLPRSMSRYSMLVHRPERASGDVWRVLAENRRLYAQPAPPALPAQPAQPAQPARADGLDGLRYDYVRVKSYRLFTLIGVKL